jgi:hypothetical protein
MKLSEGPSCVDKVKTWQQYLKAKGMLGSVSGTFDETTEAATEKYGLKIHARRDDVFILSFDRPDRDHFGTQNSGVVLPDSIRQPLTKIAYGNFILTGNELTVTSGLRTPEKQAGLMYEKARHGKKALGVYKSGKMVDDIWTAYENARKAGTGERGAIDAITAIIRDGMNRHEYISKHLTGHAFDLLKSTHRCDIESFEAVVKAVFGSVQGHLIQHEPGGPAHLHVQFDR